MGMRQTITVTLVLSVDADAAATLPGRPGRSWGLDYDEPRSGLELAADEAVDAAEQAALAALASIASIAARPTHVTASIGRPWDTSIEPF